MKGAKAALLLLAGAATGALGLEAYHWVTVPAGTAEVKPAEKEADKDTATAGVQMEAEAQKAAGIRTATIAPATLAGEQPGYARALDAGPLAAIASEAAAAAAAAAASTREAERLAALVKSDAGASGRDLEAARAQASADKARLTLACQRAGLEYGPGLGALGCGELAALARGAAAGELAILRIDVPGVALARGTSLTIDLAPGSAEVTVLGPAAAGDGQLQTAGVLALLRGSAAMRAGVGRVMAAHIPAGGGQAGLLIPREAIVRTEGALNVWRQSGESAFERIALEGAAAQPQGWFVPAGRLKVGDRIVISGAGTLLGLEHAAPAGDD